MPSRRKKSIGSGSRMEVVVPCAPRMACSPPHAAALVRLAVVGSAVADDARTRDPARMRELEPLGAEALTSS